MDDKGSQMQVDLIDGLDLYEKHYSKENESMSKQAQAIWEKMYNDRTNMIWSKEEYLSSMHTYQTLKDKVEEVGSKQKQEETKLAQVEE